MIAAWLHTSVATPKTITSLGASERQHRLEVGVREGAVGLLQDEQLPAPVDEARQEPGRVWRQRDRQRIELRGLGDLRRARGAAQAVRRIGRLVVGRVGDLGIGQLVVVGGGKVRHALLGRPAHQPRHRGSRGLGVRHGKLRPARTKSTCVSTSQSSGPLTQVLPWRAFLARRRTPSPLASRTARRRAASSGGPSSRWSSAQRVAVCPIRSDPARRRRRCARRRGTTRRGRRRRGSSPRPGTGRRPVCARSRSITSAGAPFSSP